MWMEPIVAFLTLDVSLERVLRLAAAAEALPLVVLGLEDFSLRVEFRPREVCVQGDWLQCFKLSHRHDIDFAVDGLHVDVLIVIRRKELNVFRDLVEVRARQLNFEQIALLIEPADFDLGEVWVLRVRRADRHDFPEEVRDASLLEEPADVADLENLITILKSRVHFLLIGRLARHRSARSVLRLRR